MCDFDQDVEGNVRMDNVGDQVSPETMKCSCC
jgi:hypothetical protein